MRELLAREAPFHTKAHASGVSSGISTPFGVLSPTRGVVTYALLTRAPLYSETRKPPFSFDLHVLSTPPAFILSQDQTLQFDLLLLLTL